MQHVKTEANSESDSADSGAEEDVAMDAEDGPSPASIAREKRAFRELEGDTKVKLVTEKDFFYVTGVQGKIVGEVCGRLRLVRII